MKLAVSFTELGGRPAASSGPRPRPPCRPGPAAGTRCRRGRTPHRKPTASSSGNDSRSARTGSEQGDQAGPGKVGGQQLRRGPRPGDPAAPQLQDGHAEELGRHHDSHPGRRAGRTSTNHGKAIAVISDPWWRSVRPGTAPSAASSGGTCARRPECRPTPVPDRVLSPAAASRIGNRRDRSRTFACSPVPVIAHGGIGFSGCQDRRRGRSTRWD